MEDRYHIGEHLRARRLNVNKTQAEIAEAIGATRQTVAKIENGRIGEVAFGTVEAYASEVNLKFDLERIIIRMDTG